MVVISWLLVWFYHPVFSEKPTQKNRTITFTWPWVFQELANLWNKIEWWSRALRQQNLPPMFPGQYLYLRSTVAEFFLRHISSYATQFFLAWPDVSEEGRGWIKPDGGLRNGRANGLYVPNGDNLSARLLSRDSTVGVCLPILLLTSSATCGVVWMYISSDIRERCRKNKWCSYMYIIHIFYMQYEITFT